MENNRDLIEDIEFKLDSFGKKCKDTEKKMELKEKELDELEAFINKQAEEINVLGENNHSMIKETSENVMMEKKIIVQNILIVELKEKLENMKKENLILKE